MTQSGQAAAVVGADLATPRPWRVSNARGRLGHHKGGVAVDEAHDLVPAVEVLVVAPCLFPPGVVVEMRGGVPAVRPDIAAAAEGDLVVDHDHLLVVAGAERQLAVEHEFHPRALERLAVGEGEEVLGGRDRHARIPAQDPDVDLRFRGREVL